MLYTIIIPILLCFMPWLVARYIFRTSQTKNLPFTRGLIYPVLAGAVWYASFLLPNIPISAETDSFTLHFSGGVAVALLFEYVCKVYKLRFSSWWQRPLALYFFVSGLGVANELFEFVAVKAGFLDMEGTDTWWDLVANTLGAFIAFALFRLFRRR